MASAPPTPSTPGSGGRVGGGLFLLSVVVLTLEVLSTRLFSYCLQPILIYFAVGIAFLGLGASGTLLSVWTGWRRFELAHLAAWASAGFAVTIVASIAAFARTSQELNALDLSLDNVAVLALLAVPYVLAGVAVTACLSTAAAGVHRTYRINLLGNAVGCFAVFFLLEPLGAERLLGVLALLAAGSGFLFQRGSGGPLLKAALALAALVGTLPLVAPERTFPLQPEPTGQLAKIEQVFESFEQYQGETVRLFGRWDPTGRIEVHEFTGVHALVPEPIDIYFYSQDGSAGSILFGVREEPERIRTFFERTLYGAGYALRGGADGEDVLVIGLGGGPDVMAAHLYGAGTVTGVDINQTAIDAIRGPFAEFTGDPYSRGDVTLAHMDGRTFVRSTDRSFDLIAMSGVDTKSILSAGSLSVSENTLYTVEALGEYLRRLAPGGTLALLRFGKTDRIRLAGTTIAALREMGVEHPERHFVVLRQGEWTMLLVGREPHEREAVERLERWVAAVPGPHNGIMIPMYDALQIFRLSHQPEILYSPFEEPRTGDDDVGDLFAAVREEREAESLAAHEKNVTPTTDDKPFFFDHQRRDELLAGEFMLHYRLMGRFLRLLAILAAAFIILPIPLFRARGANEAGFLRSLVYFTSLGMGFMLLEIGLVQKLVIFLGHQSYSLTVVFATLLVGAGLGSEYASRMHGTGASIVRGRAVPAILVAALVVYLLVTHGSVAAAGLPLPARIVLVAVVLFPLGFFLGMPFPTGLSTLKHGAPTLLPWAIGANGFASVIGSSAALPGAMILGYRTLLIAGLALYLVAALSYPKDAQSPD